MDQKITTIYKNCLLYPADKNYPALHLIPDTRYQMPEKNIEL